MSDPAVPPPEPGPVPMPASEHHLASSRRVKRRLILGVIGLHALALIAATLIIIRGPATGKKAKDGEKPGLLSLTHKESVGWVSIHGPIYNEGSRPWDRGSYQWGRRLRLMAETKGVKAIVLDINSPGGSVGAVQELHSQILRIRKDHNMPVVALFGDVAASGGYYLGAACDKIVAHPGTLTGSIGVLFSVSNLEGLFAKVGYKVEPIKSGIHKDIGSPARPMTKEEKALLQELIDDAYGQFLGAVVAGRKLPEEKVRPVADGRIMSGNQALAVGLVDKLGDSQDAVELAAKLGGISGTPKIRREADAQRLIFELFESRVRPPASWLSDLGLRAGLEYRWAGWP